MKTIEKILRIQAFLICCIIATGIICIPAIGATPKNMGGIGCASIMITLTISLPIIIIAREKLIKPFIKPTQFTL